MTPRRPMTPPAPTALHRARLAAVCAAVAEVLPLRGGRLLDLGCGDGAATLALAKLPGVAEVVALDPDRAALSQLVARARAEAGGGGAARIVPVAGSVLDAPAELAGRHAAVAVEVFEHLPPDRLSVLETALFRRLRPGRVVLTTPDADANAALGVPPGRLRHPDHRFEWGALRFAAWAEGAAARAGYRVRVTGIGAPLVVSRLAVFDRLDAADTPQGHGRAEPGSANPGSEPTH